MYVQEGFYFKNLLQFIKVKLAFQIMFDIIIRTNCQRRNQPFGTQISFYLWDKLLYVFLETNKGRCAQKFTFTTNTN